ncbi:MAG: hypothetical protein H6R24_2558 [Proteobacteria bacterium]|jgi:hypothetical protein|nr:hypothetical protein [Pseudomonadota bacterium]
MDISALAAAATSCLTPALPYLIKAGEKGVEMIGGKMGVGVWETAKAIWQRLSSNPSIELAAREVASAPGDQDAQAALRYQLRKVLAADEQLALALARLLEEGSQSASYHHAEVHGEGAVAQGPGAVAAGKGGVAVGGDVHGDVRIGGTETMGTAVKH